MSIFLLTNSDFLQSNTIILETNVKINLILFDGTSTFCQNIFLRKEIDGTHWPSC